MLCVCVWWWWWWEGGGAGWLLAAGKPVHLAAVSPAGECVADPRLYIKTYSVILLPPNY